MKLFKEYQGLIESAQKILDEAKGSASGPAGGPRRTNAEIEEAKWVEDEAPSAEDLAYVKKDFANMVKIFKKKIAKMERLVVKLKEKLASAKTPKGKANIEDRLYTETDAVKWHKEWLRDAEAKGKKGIEKGDYDTIESAVDDLGAWAFDSD